MLGSFNSMFSKLKSVNIVSTVTDNYNKLKDKVLNKLTITRIIPQLYHIDYPQENNVEQLVTHIGFSPYQIWNISEYRYEDKFESAMKQKAPFGEICFLYYEYFSNIPFYELVHAIGKIQQFISANPAHRVYVHCQDSKVRSAVFLAAYLFQTGAVQVQDISEAILFVNRCLQMQLEDTKQGVGSSYKNNHRLFKNLVNYHNNPNFINPWRLKLQKIIITNAPRINIQSESGKGELKIVIELRDAESVLFKGTFPSAVIEGDCIGLNFHEKGKELVISDEFLLMVKYSWNKKIYSILRIQLNTNFIFQQFARIQQQDIDLSVHCVASEMGTFVDLMFEEEKGKSKLAMLTEKVAERRKKKELKKEQNVDLLSGEGVTAKQQSAGENISLISEAVVMPVVEATKPEAQLMFAISELNDIKIESGVVGSQLEVAEQPHDLNEKQLSLRIEEAMKVITKKEEDVQEQQQDLDDYLSKLQSLA